MKKKIIALIAAVSMVAVSMTACNSSKSSSAASSSSSQASSSSSQASGSLTISGSSALQPLVQAAADDLKAKDSSLSITVNAGGSGTGLQNVYDKTVDIGDSDLFAQEKLDASKASSLTDHIVCVIGVAAVTNPAVKVTNITKQQLIGIFTGKIKNWKELGGADQQIVIVNRPASSGTRGLFKKYALDGKTEASGMALTEDNSGVLKQTVAQTPGAIAYLAFSYLKGNTVTALSIDNVKPTYDNIYSGKYNVWGYEHMYTFGEATGNAKTLIDYISSDAFSKTVMDKGYGLYSKMTVKRAAPSASK